MPRKKKKKKKKKMSTKDYKIYALSCNIRRLFKKCNTLSIIREFLLTILCSNK
jgi:hypothetical protein